MAQQGYEEDLLRRWFPANAEKTLSRFTENDIRGIADVLTRCARDRWSRVPRLYSILRKIGQLDVIDAFIDSDMTDVYFPFDKNTLPEALCDHSARLRFLELQHLVYNTEALNLERHARHGHFSDPTEVPLKKVGELGKGGYGYVDRVVSTISHQEYARKLILRGKTFKKNKQVLKDFTKELSNLKRLFHRHLVELVGSYTDKKFVAIIMLPVADTNLHTFMERPDLDERARSFLRPFFGCLTSALSYLHDNRIRHKDIKPSNILIKNDQVYFTDFGTSLDWSGRDNSTTETAVPTTPRYCAPEVMAYVERNTAADIWSFGCVFLEMWTVLKHRTLKDLHAHMSAQGTRVEGYHSNPEAIASWIAILRQMPGPSSDLLPVDWIVNMLQEKPVARWNVHTLDNYIGEASIESSAQHTFKGLCCLELEDETTENSRLSDEDLVSLVVPPSRPQGPDGWGNDGWGNPSWEKRRVKGNDSIQDRVIVRDVSATLVASKVSNGVTEPPCLLHPCPKLGSSLLRSEKTGFDVKEPTRKLLQRTEELFDHANSKDNGSLRTLSSPPNSAPSIGNSEGILGNYRALTLPRSAYSSDDESYISAPPYQGLSSDSVPVVGHQLESTQATSKDDNDSTSCSPFSTKCLEAEALTSCSVMVFPKTELETEVVCDFDQHARDCSNCYNPLGIYLRNRYLCATGFAYAAQLLQYICRFDGQIYQTTECQYICEPSLQLWPVFRAGSSPPRTIPTEYVQVKSLLKAVERSMLNQSSSVPKDGSSLLLEKRESWIRLHMCVICKRNLGGPEPEIFPITKVDQLSCSHQVHSYCRWEVDKLDCPNERYCSLCPESTLAVLEMGWRDDRSAAASIEEPRDTKLKDKDIRNGAYQEDPIARSGRHDKPKAKSKSKLSPDPKRQLPFRNQTRKIPALSLPASNCFAPHQPISHRLVHPEVGGRDSTTHPVPSSMSFESERDLAMPSKTRDHVDEYEYQAPLPMSSGTGLNYGALGREPSPFSSRVILNNGVLKWTPEYIGDVYNDTIPARRFRPPDDAIRRKKDSGTDSPTCRNLQFDVEATQSRIAVPSIPTRVYTASERRDNNNSSVPIEQRRSPLPREEQDSDSPESDDTTDSPNFNNGVDIWNFIDREAYNSLKNKPDNADAWSIIATRGLGALDGRAAISGNQQSRKTTMPKRSGIVLTDHQANYDSESSGSAHPSDAYPYIPKAQPPSIVMSISDDSESTEGAWTSEDHLYIPKAQPTRVYNPHQPIAAKTLASNASFRRPDAQSPSLPNPQENDHEYRSDQATVGDGSDQERVRTNKIYHKIYQRRLDASRLARGRRPEQESVQRQGRKRTGSPHYPVRGRTGNVQRLANAGEKRTFVF